MEMNKYDELYKSIIIDTSSRTNGAFTGEKFDLQNFKNPFLNYSDIFTDFKKFEKNTENTEQNIFNQMDLEGMIPDLIKY
jgi:hypothetical protein